MLQFLPGGKKPDGQTLRFYGSASSMKSALAIYDMDRTITRRPTYAAFMWRATTRLAPWRIVLAPLVLLTGLAYLLGFIDRGRL